MVQLYVSQLRRLLAGDDAQIVTHGRGYELRLPDDAVDVTALRAPRGATGHGPRDALALWRGSALADVADEPFADAEIRRLDELWLRATELADRRRPGGGARRSRLLARARAPGRGAPAVGSGCTACACWRCIARAARPRRSRPTSPRGGRLIEVAGIEPDRRAARAARARSSGRIPRCGCRAGTAASRARTGGRRRPAAHGRRRRARSAAPAPQPRGCSSRPALVAVGGRRGPRRRTAWTGPDSCRGSRRTAVGLIDPDAARVVAHHSVGRDPSAIAAGGGSVWVANARDGTVSRIEPGSATDRDDPRRRRARGLAFAAGSVWVSDRQDRHRVADQPRHQPRRAAGSRPATPRAASPPGSARCGSRRRSTARSRGSISRAARWARRSISARTRRRSPPAPAPCG